MKSSVGQVVRFIAVIDNVNIPVITVREASYRYNFSPRTIQKWCDEGKLIFIKIENRYWIHELDIERFVKATDNVQLVEA